MKMISTHWWIAPGVELEARRMIIPSWSRRRDKSNLVLNKC